MADWLHTAFFVALAFFGHWVFCKGIAGMLKVVWGEELMELAQRKPEVKERKRRARRSRR
jgi:hypothetical protein